MFHTISFRTERSIVLHIFWWWFDFCILNFQLITVYTKKKSNTIDIIFFSSSSFLHFISQVKRKIVKLFNNFLFEKTDKRNIFPQWPINCVPRVRVKKISKISFHTISREFFHMIQPFTECLYQFIVNQFSQLPHIPRELQTISWLYIDEILCERYSMHLRTLDWPIFFTLVLHIHFQFQLTFHPIDSMDTSNYVKWGRKRKFSV